MKEWKIELFEGHDYFNRLDCKELFEDLASRDFAPIVKLEYSEGPLSSGETKEYLRQNGVFKEVEREKWMMLTLYFDKEYIGYNIDKIFRDYKSLGFPNKKSEKIWKKILGSGNKELIEKYSDEFGIPTFYSNRISFSTNKKTIDSLKNALSIN